MSGQGSSSTELKALADVLEVCEEGLKDQLLKTLVEALSFSRHKTFQDALLELGRGELVFVMLLAALKASDARMSSLLIKAADKITLFPRITRYMLQKIRAELVITKQDFDTALTFAKSLNKSGYAVVPVQIVQYIEHLSQEIGSTTPQGEI